MSKASGWISLDKQLDDISDLLKNIDYGLHKWEFGVTFGGGDDTVIDGVCPLRIIQFAGGIIAIPQGALVACDWWRGRLLRDVLPTPVYLSAENLKDACGIPGRFCGFLCCSTGRVEKIDEPQAPNYPSRLSLWGRAVCWECRGSVSELKKLIEAFPQTKYRFAVEWPVELAECGNAKLSSKTSAVLEEKSKRSGRW